MSGPSPVELRWALPIARPVEAVWPMVSDTDRFNRSAGLGMTFREVTGPDGTVVREGEIRRFGLRIRWEERPFTFRAPERWTQERVYANGPVARVLTTARLEPDGPDACVLHYAVDLHPRGFLVRPVVQAEVQLSTRPDLDRTLQELVRACEGRPNRYDQPPAPLGGDETRLLADGLFGLEPPELALALREHVERAPLPEQQRLRPLEMAERLGLDADLVIRGFLDAVRRGVLELRWELMCPSCRAPKAGSSRLELDPGAVHCPSCNIHYDGSFPDSVEVVFRVARRLRDTDVEVACLLSPSRTPHVLAQEPIEPDGEITWRLPLDVGGFRLDTDPPFGGASIEVRPGVRAERLTVDLTPRGVRPAVLRVRPGTVSIVLRNRTGRPVRAQLERRERAPGALTAGRLFELPDSRDLLPPEAVAPGIEVSVRSAWAVAVGQVAAEAGQTGDWDLEGEAEANGVLLRTFDELADALDFLEPLDGDPDVSAGLARGPVVVLAEGDDEIPSGRAIESALDVMRAVGGGSVALAVADVQEVAPALSDRADLGPGVEAWYQTVRFHRATEARAQRLTSPRPDVDALPAEIDGYAVHAEVGRGAMGRVLSATSPDGRDVVLKVLLPDLARDPDHAQRFYNEAHLTRTLRHPNVVEVHDYGTTASGQTYLVMEHLIGSELKEVLRKGPLRPERARDVGVGLLRGLQAAHDAGVVHRDVKPANVFVLTDGTVKVLDFGIAQGIEEADELAARGIVLGSPRYMAPEQIAREPMDGRSDVYSASIVVYECICGDVPFHGADPLSLARARLHTDPTPLHDRCADLPVGLEAVVMRGLSRERDARYGSAAEMAEALDHC